MKKIKTLFYSIAGLMLLPAVNSCTKKIEDAYMNPNAAVRQPIETLLPNVISSLCVSFTAQGTNFGPQNDGQYVGRYVQFWATNSSGNQYDLMGQTTTNSTAATADIGGSQWGMHYYAQGANLNRIIEWGTEEKKWDYVGVAHAIRAFGWLAVTDMHGEVILKDAFNPNLLVFGYDKQEDVYEEVKKECRLAIDFLSRTGDSVSATNLEKGAAYFSLKGDVEKWKKFAYTTMARVFHRVTNKATYSADSVIKYCDLAINSNTDNAYILFSGAPTSGTNSFYGPFRGNAGGFRQTKFIADLESGLNSSFLGVADPRAWYIIRENTNNTFKGIRPGKGVEALTTNDQPRNFWGGTYSTTTGTNANARYIFKDAMPWPVMTACEIQFIKAEALYRKGDKAGALTAYKNGISLNIDMLNTDYSASVPTAKLIDATAKNNFLNNPLVVPPLANFNLSHIMLQKYIALYGYGFMETWADLRRFHYVDVEQGTSRQVYTDFAPPALTDLFANNNQKYIYRVRPRYNSEFLYNIDALTQIGALALDYHTKEQWFSQP